MIPVINLDEIEGNGTKKVDLSSYLLQMPEESSNDDYDFAKFISENSNPILEKLSKIEASNEDSFSQLDNKNLETSFQDREFGKVVSFYEKKKDLEEKEEKAHKPIFISLGNDEVETQRESEMEFDWRSPSNELMYKAEKPLDEIVQKFEGFSYNNLERKIYEAAPSYLDLKYKGLLRNAANDAQFSYGNNSRIYYNRNRSSYRF